MKKALILTVLLASVPVLGFSQTAFTVRNAAGWIEAVNGIRSGGNGQDYTITVTDTVSVPAAPSNENTFGTVTGITVTIEGSGTLSPSNNGSLLRIGKDQTVIAKDLTLKGRDANDAAVVYIAEGGTFRMEGKASVTGNKSSYGYSDGSGGGVYVDGTFTMQDSATVSGNTSSSIYSVRGGGGVYVGARYNNRTLIQGSFTMKGSASVSGNTSYDVGGGVYVYGGTFTMQDSASVSGNTSSNGGGGVYVGGIYIDNGRQNQGTFTMQDSATVSGNTSSSRYSEHGGGGVHVNRGTFTMSGGTISGNTTTYEGGGVSVNHYYGIFTMSGGLISGNKANKGGGVDNSNTFTMSGGTISGNTANNEGGGVYNYKTFTMSDGTISGNKANYGGGVYGNLKKTGGTVYGDDAEQKLKNTVISRLGHALYKGWNEGWRNATAGPTMNSDGYGFWLNEGEGNVVMFPSGFSGTWRRSNFNNTLTIRVNVIKSSSSSYYWVLQRISGNAYTLKRADAANMMTLTIIRLDGLYTTFVISGDSGSGENNWNGTWRRLDY